MARIDDLLRRVPDAQLRADLTAAIAEVRRTRDFGLVYESHLPETCRLYSHPIRRGVKVAVRSDDGDALYLVESIDGSTARLVPLRAADGVAVAADEQTPVEMPVEDLVVVAEFGDPIHPGLKRVGSLDRGGDKPAHVVINAENHHALEALQFTHAGKVDCIYIDPPYNTGARDWKYNNDYVDANDTYRHSKWLAMMERRLRLAKRLLNPENSVLICAIDEKEVSRLALLLDQTFTGCDIQFVTVVTNHAGSIRRGRFTRVEEYMFVVFVGAAIVGEWDRNMLGGKPETTTAPTVWFSAIRTGGRAALRENRSSPVLFYPVHVDVATDRFHSVGPPLPLGDSRDAYTPPTGTYAVWPLSSGGREQTWQVSGPKLTEHFALGFARIRGGDGGRSQPAITYLRKGTIEAIQDGRYQIAGRSVDGGVEIEFGDSGRDRFPPTAVWYQQSHFARDYGTQVNSRLIPGRAFPFPKSLYVVEDALRFAIRSKPDAIVLDFFAGSGTTAHAVMRLNRQDGGQRQSILVTNNEVSADEAKALTKTGHRVGDPEWEAQGIFEHVTRPRITAAVTGRTPEGEPVKGDYKFVDEFPMADGFEENVEFYELTYQDAAAVELDLAFEAVAPLLWLRAGGQGGMVGKHDEAGFAWVERYGVLWDTDRWQAFVTAAPESAVTAFVVTDSATAFAAVSAELPAGVEPVRLYENYLSTFTINQVEPS